MLGEAGDDTPRLGDLKSGAPRGRCACGPEAPTGPGHRGAPGAVGANCTRVPQTPEEHVPTQTRVGKLDPMGIDMTSNSERKSNSDEGIGAHLSTKGKEGSSNVT
jgi:hypothetical protein